MDGILSCREAVLLLLHGQVFLPLINSATVAAGKISAPPVSAEFNNNIMPTNDDDWKALPAPHQPRGHKVLSVCVYVYLDGTHLIIGNRTQQPQRLMGIVRGQVQQTT